MSIVILGSTSGSITLQEPAVAGSTVLSLPATTGTVLTSASPASDLPSSIKGPAFSVYSNANQSITTTTLTKVSLQLEEFDTSNAFDSTTNFRFTPQVAGYYQVNGSITNGITPTRQFCTIYKNGSEFKRGNDISSNLSTTNVNALIYLNGSTDYIELYAFIIGTNPTITADSIRTFFQASMVRAA